MTELRRVYTADVGTLPEDTDRLLAKLPTYRREKIARLRFEKDRRLSLGAGLLLQRALCDAGFCEADEAPQIGKHGKPFFPAYPEFHFNLSHSGTQVLCAVAVTEVGCDVEKITAYNDRLAKRFFHPQEYAALCALSTADEQAELFYRLWTLKESFLKATGRGLSLPLNDFSVLDSDGGIGLCQGAVPGKFGLYEFSVSPQYRAACCIADDDGDAPPEVLHIALAGQEKDRSL